MNVTGLGNIACQTIQSYKGVYEEHSILVCDTETIRGRPYTIQFYDGNKVTLEYVNEDTIFDCYLDYVRDHFESNMSVWFFYCQFDLPIIHYPFKEYFTYDNHRMGYGDYDFTYVTGKTWYGNHVYKNQKWFERDAFQYVFRGLEKIAKDLELPLMKLKAPSFLGQRAWKTLEEKQEFESYAKQDVLVLWELVYWILSIHRQYNVGLSVSLADLCGKIFRKKFVDSPIVSTSQSVTLAALSSYHGGKTQMYVNGPIIIRDIYEYDITSAYPYAMSQIGNVFDYEIQPAMYLNSGRYHDNALYKVNAQILCKYQPIFSEEFKRQSILRSTWITGYELNSCLEKQCIQYEVLEGFEMVFHNGKENGLSNYVWEFFEKKRTAKMQKNKTEELWAKLALNSLYGKFISRIMEDHDIGDKWKGGVIFHPLIATLITGFVRAYVHSIEHVCCSFHTSTDSFITKCNDLDMSFTGVNGLGGLKKEYQGDVLLVRPKVYVIFDKLNINCYHKFQITDDDVVYCQYCQAKVLKSATHGFYGSTQMLLNMWKGNQVNYVVNRMIRLKEAKRRRDPEVLPFVFTDQRRSLNVDWSALTIQ